MSAPADHAIALDSFDARVRAETLRVLAARGDPPPPASGNVNLHVHSFYSYNAQGWSPSRIAWEAVSRGLYAAGMCDFDVLDGLEEFYRAGLSMGLRTCVHLETRAFVPELSGVDINSPGEHGVAYAMGAGFRRRPEAGDPGEPELERFRSTAAARNHALVARISAAFPEVALVYERDVTPLTPAGVATERHIIRAFVDRCIAGGPAASTRLLGDLLQKKPVEIGPLLGDRAALEEAVRARLVKRGGLAYAQPDTSSFPPVRDFFAWVTRCGALPMTAWLDGTSGGEGDAARLLDVMGDAGACALNIIPERNWNLRDAADRERKIGKLHQIVREAERREIPINVGTEMNRTGLPFADDLGGPVLREHAEVFLRGARVMVGHAILLRYAGCSYAGEWARAELGEAPGGRAAFFGAVGGLPPLTQPVARRLVDAGEVSARSVIRDSVRAGRWFPGAG